MAVPHGSAATFSLDNSSGTPVALTGYSPEVSLSPEIAIHMTTVFGATAQAKVVGLKDAKLTVSFRADPTLSLHLNNLYVAQTPGSATSWSFVYGPNGSTSGFKRVSGECYLVGFPIESKVDDIRNITAQFEVTGALTFDTF